MACKQKRFQHLLYFLYGALDHRHDWLLNPFPRGVSRAAKNAHDQAAAGRTHDPPLARSLICFGCLGTILSQGIRLICVMVNAQPSLVHFQIVQVQGQQHKFAWITVAFELLQSKVDPVSGKRLEQLQTDPTTGQPIIHYMAVILVRILPQSQGTNAPMGGTGWLVNTYELDTNTLPAIAIDPSL